MRDIDLNCAGNFNFWDGGLSHIFLAGVGELKVGF